MTKQVLQILLVFSLILIFERCAQIVPLNGGKRDTTPPKLVKAFPENNSVDFKFASIILLFDEFVQVKNLSTQLIVSPRLKTTPEISADGKKITIGLKTEELLPNTTYRFSFGKAIVDMHESNPVENFEFAFSTGSFIDSLKINGDVTEAFNNKASANILVGLYYGERTGDSLPYKTEPDYYTRSNDRGEFIFKNLPYKTFRVFGFSDNNKNSLYDGETEKIAFLQSDLELISDTSIHLKLFQEEASKSFIKKTQTPYFGFTQIFLNKKAQVRLRTLNPEDEANVYETNVDRVKDTISFYYKNINDTLGLVLYNLSAGKTDTLKIAVPKNKPAKKKFKNYSLNTNGNKLALYDKLKLTFLNWMDTSQSDLSKIKFSSKEDSLVGTLPLKGHWQSITSFELDLQLKEGVNYTLKIDTNAFFDLNQLANDSNAFNFTTQSKAEFGKLTLKLVLNQKQDYIVQLINEQEQVVRQKFVSLSLSSSNATALDFTDIPPAVYFAKIILMIIKTRNGTAGMFFSNNNPKR